MNNPWKFEVDRSILTCLNQKLSISYGRTVGLPVNIGKLRFQKYFHVNLNLIIKAFITRIQSYMCIIFSLNISMTLSILLSIYISIITHPFISPICHLDFLNSWMKPCKGYTDPLKKKNSIRNRKRFLLTFETKN